MLCPNCRSPIEDDAEACFHCGMAVFALTRGAVLAGRYEILRPLGRGGMGRVYEARDRVMEEHVALKVLRGEFMRDPAMARRFVSEIKLARKIGHRNVCRIHEYGEDGHTRFIVMELLSGVTLKEHLHEAPLAPDVAYDVAIQVARGLNAVHELGIVHRDVKTANIMIDEAGVAKIVDFGIAKEVSADLTDPSAAGMIMVTPEYLSPEQVHGGPGSFHGDVYALGCVVYELFTGHAPFRGATPVATFLMHLNDPIPFQGEDARHIPAALVPVLKRALAKDPAGRYQSIAEFATALSAAAAAGGFLGDAHRGGLRLSPPPSSARAAPTTEPASTPARPWWRERAPRTWEWAVALTAIVVGALALLAYPRAAAVILPPVTPMASASPDSPPPTAPSAMPSDILAPSLATTVPETPAPLRPSPAPSTSPSRSPSPAAPVTGTLRLLVVPESRVTIDGTALGPISRRELPLGPGTHTVRVEHPDYQPLQRRVTIREHEAVSLVIDLAEKGIRR